MVCALASLAIATAAWGGTDAALNVRVSHPNAGGFDERHNESWLPIAEVSIYGALPSRPKYCVAVNAADLGCHPPGRVLRYNTGTTLPHANNTCWVTIGNGTFSFPLLNAETDVLLVLPPAEQPRGQPLPLRAFEVRQGFWVFADGASKFPVSVSADFLASAEQQRDLHACARIGANPTNCSSMPADDVIQLDFDLPRGTHTLIYWVQTQGGTTIARKSLPFHSFRYPFLGKSVTLVSADKVDRSPNLDEVVNDGLFFPKLRRNLSCLRVFRRQIAGLKPADQWPPPRRPPINVANAFQEHRTPIRIQNYFAERYTHGEGYKAFSGWLSRQKVNAWSRESVEAFLRTLQSGGVVGQYGQNANRVLSYVFEKYFDHPALSTTSGFVLGSEVPWVEALAIRSGASKLLTVEYGELNSTHPQIDAITPLQLANQILNHDVNGLGPTAVTPFLEKFDFGVSYHSLEHSGLGRYGDELNPRADIEAMEQAWCLTKPGGLFFLGIPISSSENSSKSSIASPEGYIRWNSDRVYGTERLKQLMANWDVLGLYPGWEMSFPLYSQAQPVFVLQKQQ